jgi:tellurite resistance protein TehA-like permease
MIIHSQQTYLYIEFSVFLFLHFKIIYIIKYAFKFYTICFKLHENYISLNVPTFIITMLTHTSYFKLFECNVE